jgi:CheY-like chemotaxis protein
MNGILGMSELLLDANLPPKLRDFAETIRSSTEALLTIINDILDFSKIEAGKLALNHVNFDLRDTVETVAELLAGRAEAKGIELVIAIPAGTPTAVNADAGRLRQVLTNLVGNAVKFTDHGEVMVRVTQLARQDGEARLRFEVKDTGIGVSKEVQERIFQAFTQADGSTTRRFGGTGLGLAISKQLVELMGGTIGVESTPGQGSTFWFELPLQLQRGVESHTGLRFPGQRALVADDNVTHAAVLREMLVELGLEAETCSSADAALEALRSAAHAGKAFRLIVADVQIHDNEGLALAAVIKKDPLLRGTDVILMTDLDEDVDGASEENIAAKLAKPVRQKRLISCLASVLLGAKARPEAAATESPVAVLPSLGSLRVLLAEDNAVNRKVALRQLEKIGLSADTVTDGHQVLEALEKQPYDVILMDCQMPGLDGYQTTREIRKREAAAGKGGARVYIVAMTANALVGDREECIGAGMDDYIVKPVEVSKLSAALSRGSEHVLTAVLKSAPPAGDHAAGAAGGAEGTIDFAVLGGFGDLSDPEQAPAVVELIDLFLEDAPSQIGKIAAAIETGNRPDLRLFAHTLKGSAINMGARPLAAVCLQLEQLASIADETQERELLSKLHAEWDRTRNALETAKRGAGGGRS